MEGSEVFTKDVFHHGVTAIKRNDHVISLMHELLNPDYPDFEDAAYSLRLLLLPENSDFEEEDKERSPRANEN